MIYTVTVNPALDYVMQLKKVDAGSVNRSNDCQFLAGGKGINVSQILNQLDVDNTAWGFVGGLLVGLWHIQVPAPHGGLWVSPLSNHILLYFVATIIGSIVAGLIMSFWKKPVSKYPDE